MLGASEKGLASSKSHVLFLYNVRGKLRPTGQVWPLTYYGKKNLLEHSLRARRAELSRYNRDHLAL